MFVEQNNVKQDDEQKVKPSLVPLALELENFLQHNLDIITDSDWFEDLVEEKLKSLLAVDTDNPTDSDWFDQLVKEKVKKIMEEKNG